ncbi:MAG: hypothetical protein V1734_00120 [Nanoarchaeota archaeon]
MNCIRKAVDKILGDLEHSLERERQHFETLHRKGGYGDVTTKMLEARMKMFADEKNQVSALRNGDITLGAVKVVCKYYLDPAHLTVEGSPVLPYKQFGK